ncbi:MAG: LysE family translocator [Pseudomonadota bacterium]
MTNLLIFVPACFALNLTFGPNNLLAVTHGAAAGPIFAMRAGLGRLLAFIPLIAASAAGLGLVLSASATVFAILKLIGALYLCWIGFKILRSARNLSGWEASDAPCLRLAFRREALVAIGNPKAILIFAAFLPQFVDPAHYWTSYLQVGVMFLALELVGIAFYAGLGRVLARAGGRYLRRLQEASGLGMIVFGLLLAFTRRPVPA